MKYQTDKEAIGAAQGYIHIIGCSTNTPFLITVIIIIYTLYPKRYKVLTMFTQIDMMFPQFKVKTIVKFSVRSIK